MEEFLEVEFRPDTSEGPQLHFDIRSLQALSKLVALFRTLAECSKDVALSECDFMKLNNFEEMHLVRVAEGREPRRNLWAEKGEKVFHWVHDPEGWIQCAELAEGLKEDTHQYFDYDKPGDIEVRVSFRSLPS